MARREKEGAVNVFIGSDCSLEGTLNFSGQARLDGAFKGSIQGSGCLLVGPAARVEASIVADEVVVSGMVIGDVKAGTRLELRKPGKLVGDITSPLVMIDEGVTFEGRCSMAGEAGETDKSKVSLLNAGANPSPPAPAGYWRFIGPNPRGLRRGPVFRWRIQEAPPQGSAQATRFISLISLFNIMSIPNGGPVGTCRRRLGATSQ